MNSSDRHYRHRQSPEQAAANIHLLDEYPCGISTTVWLHRDSVIEAYPAHSSGRLLTTAEMTYSYLNASIGS